MPVYSNKLYNIVFLDQVTGQNAACSTTISHVESLLSLTLSQDNEKINEHII